MELGRSERTTMMMTSASASGGDGAGAGRAQRGTGSSTAIAKFCSTDGRALGFALAGLRRARLGKISGIWQRSPCSLPPRARARLGGAMPTDLLDLLERCSGSWPHDSMVRSPAAPSPIPFS
jgi:hypothetical protein